MEIIQYTTEKQIEDMLKELDAALEKNAKGAKGFRCWAKRIIGMFLSLIIVILVVIFGLVLTARAKGKTVSILGYSLYIVESGSMQPTFNIGTVILTKEPDDPNNLSVGDVVTFKTESGATVTHRIIEKIIDQDGNVKYRTKGDNPINSPDPDLLDPERIVAVFVFKIPLT